jgi:hypothetical protein
MQSKLDHHDPQHFRPPLNDEYEWAFNGEVRQDNAGSYIDACTERFLDLYTERNVDLYDAQGS